MKDTGRAHDTDEGASHVVKEVMCYTKGGLFLVLEGHLPACYTCFSAPVHDEMIKSSFQDLQKPINHPFIQTRFDGAEKPLKHALRHLSNISKTYITNTNHAVHTKYFVLFPKSHFITSEVNLSDLFIVYLSRSV